MPDERTIDGKDEELLSILQFEARVSNAELARRVGLAASAVFERVRKLEAKGVIRAYETRLDPRAVGRGLLAFVFVRVDEPVGAPDTGQLLTKIPEVLEVHHVAGEDCYLVKVRAADPQDLGRVLRERLGVIPSVRSTRSTIALETLKETSALDVFAARGAAPAITGESS